MESQLKGEKGKETFYVDNLGKVIEVLNKKESKSGNDVYLSIDKDLQKKVYKLLEQEVAGVLYNSIRNIRSYHAGSASTSSDVIIPIYDVYFALIDNNVVDIDKFASEDAMSTQQQIYSKFKSQYKSKVGLLKNIRDLMT